jgi:hypothetical protein
MRKLAFAAKEQSLFRAVKQRLSHWALNPVLKLTRTIKGSIFGLVNEDRVTDVPQLHSTSQSAPGYLSPVPDDTVLLDNERLNLPVSQNSSSEIARNLGIQDPSALSTEDTNRPRSTEPAVSLEELLFDAKIE